MQLPGTIRGRIPHDGRDPTPAGRRSHGPFRRRSEDASRTRTTQGPRRDGASGVGTSHRVACGGCRPRRPRIPAHAHHAPRSATPQWFRDCPVVAHRARSGQRVEGPPHAAPVRHPCGGACPVSPSHQESSVPVDRAVMRAVWEWLPARRDRRRVTLPSVIAVNLGFTQAEVCEALQTLASTRAVVLDPGGGYHRGLSPEWARTC